MWRRPIGVVGVDGRVQVDLAHALELAHEVGIGRQQFARCRTLDVTLAEAGVQPLD